MATLEGAHAFMMCGK